MENLGIYAAQLESWFFSLNLVSVGVQLIIISLALLFGRVSNAKLRKSALLSVVDGNQPAMPHLARRTLERILFPLSALAFIVVAQGLLIATGQARALLSVAVPLLLSLALIRVSIYLLRKAMGSAPLDKAWEQFISLGIWGLVALHLVGWLDPVLNALDSMAMQLGSARVSVLSSLKLVLLIGLLFAIALWVARSIEKRVKQSKHLSRSVQAGISKFAKFGLLTAAFVLALDSVGIDLTALTVFGGALGVGIGFGLQRIASNFISGFILIMDRSIKPGDVITIGDKFGWVEELRARYIVVRNRDGEENLIPNENLITSEVINWSYTDSNVRVKLPVQISYHNDPEKALDVLVQAANSCERVLQNPEPTARLMSFGDNGINLELRVWISDPQNGLGNVRTEVNLAIWKTFKNEGIVIPFPQRDVYIRQMPEVNRER